MMRPLSTFVEFIRGVTYAGGEGSPKSSPDSSPILRAGNISHELLLNTDLIWVPKTRISGNQWLRKDDIAMCLSSGSSQHVGKCARLRQEWLGSIGGFCGILRPKMEVSPSFLEHWLHSAAFLDWRDSQSRGSNIQNLQFAELGSLRVDFPDRATQGRIADALDTQFAHIDTARQAAERRVKAAEGLEAALLREAFHGVVPVVIGAPQEAAPAGWSWQRLATLARLESGHTPSRKHPEWWGGDIPWIALPDIRALDGKVAMETKEKTNPAGIANSSARILPPDTVMLSRTASVGFVAIMGRPMATSQDFVNWVCGERLAPRFLMHALRSGREYFLSQASGAIHKTLYMPALKDLSVCLPDRPAQDVLAARLDDQLAAAATVLASARAELKAIEALPAAVLRRVFEPAPASS